MTTQLISGKISHYQVSSRYFFIPDALYITH